MVKRFRRNKKGFSLVELIIVIAIMVALIAVMAPNFVKYVQKSRDTALQTAAEDFLSSVKVAYGDPESEYTLPTNSDYTIEIKIDWGTKKLSITSSSVPSGDLTNLIKASGADLNKAMGTSQYKYTITISAGPTFKMVGDSVGNPKT